MLYGPSKVGRVTFQQPLSTDEEIIAGDDLSVEREDLLVRLLNRFSFRLPSPAKKGSDQVGRSACSDSFGRVSTLENKVQKSLKLEQGQEKLEKGQEKLEKGQEKHGVMLDEITRKMDVNQNMLKKMGEMITPSSWPFRTLERKGSGRSSERGCFQCGKSGHFQKECPNRVSSPGRSPENDRGLSVQNSFRTAQP